MANVSGIGLKEPGQINWDNYNPGSKYMAPPPAIGPDGKRIKYFGVVPKIEESAFGVNDDGYRTYTLDPIVITRSGAGADGYALRFTRVSTKQFEKNGKPIDASSVGNFLRSAGILAKPQKNLEYDAAVKMASNKVVSFSIDWRAKNKDTQEEVRGYNAFPDDPERPGQKKSILKAGDTVYELDAKGNRTGVEKKVTSEVLFANAQLQFFNDPSRK